MFLVHVRNLYFTFLIFTFYFVLKGPRLYAANKPESSKGITCSESISEEAHNSAAYSREEDAEENRHREETDQQSCRKNKQREETNDNNKSS